MSRLSIEIEPEQHRQIKTLATFEGMTIKDFILMKTLPRKEEDVTTALLKSPRNAERLKTAISEPTSSHRVFETLEDLEDALGI
jgi:uncharacterized protein (DUF1778 family)